MMLLSVAGSKTFLTHKLLLNLTKQPCLNRTFVQQAKLFRPNKNKFNSVLLNRQNLALNISKNFLRWQGNSSSNSKPKMTTKEIIQKLARFIWPKDKPGIKIRVVIAVALLIGSKLLNVAVPFLFKEIVDFLNKNGKIKDFGDSTADKIVITAIALVIGYGAARAGASLFGELRSAIFATVAQSSVTQLATQVFRHLHKLDLNFHLNRQTGALSKAIDRGTRGISFVLSALLFNIAPTILEVAMVSGILYAKFGLNYALVSVGCIAGYTTFTFLTTQWRTKFRVDMNKAENEAGNKAIDSLINFETVKYFNNDDYEVKRYQESLKKYEASAIKTSTSLAFLNFGQNAIFSTGLTAIMLLASYGVMGGEMTVGDLVMCNGLLFQLSLPLNFLGTVYREVRQSIIDMQNMFDLTAVQTSIQEKPNAPNLIISPTTSAIIFDKVRFKYTEGADLFSELSFEVPSGKKIAIVGGSGSGKSTIVRLLYRFYDPIEGRILINNQDIKNVSLNSLRQTIGIVPQDTVLFNDTILYNIHYGNMRASIEDVYDVAKMSDLHNTISKMPKQYNTIVGERGLKLSGGEKQRVAIARTMLKNPYIFVYDEATSSLDSITEQTIMKSLRKLIHGRTSICIAHRLITVIDADEIFVLEKGKVVERGSHKKLISEPSSLYHTLWQKQSDQSFLKESEANKI
nr:ATP-binding cassette subfamily B7-1 [Brachionus rubens]